MLSSLYTCLFLATSLALTLNYADASLRARPALRVCSSNVGESQRFQFTGAGSRVGDGPPAAVDFDKLIALVPRSVVTSNIAVYMRELLCELEMKGWILLDIDATAVTADIAADLQVPEY